MTEKSNANVNAIQAVEQLWKKIPQPLQKLLEKEGLEAGAEPPSRASKVSIQRRLEKQGLLEQAKDWISAFASAARLTIPSKSRSIATEIAWRYVEAKAHAEREQWLRDVYVDGQADPNADKLPIEINWVYRHPLIKAVAGDESPTLLKSAQKYELEHKCPSVAARARLSSVRSSAKSIDDFMKHVDKILTGTAASRREQDEKARKVGVVELAEEESIADLEVQLLQEMEAKKQELGENGQGDDAGVY